MSTKKKVATTHALPSRTNVPAPLEPPSPRRSTIAAADGSNMNQPIVPLPQTQTMNPYGPGIGAVSAQSLYWSNLSLLGFDAHGQSQRYKIELYPGMFDKPNAKGMQLVMHFLLLKIKLCPQADQHNQSQEWKDLTTVFHHSYPCIDRTQARDFLACCVGALLGFEKGSANVFPAGTIRKSHFAAPQGDRLYTIFWHLSTYALHLTLTHNSPAYHLPSLSLPSLTDHALFPHLVKAIKMHINRQAGMYLTRTKEHEQATQQWFGTAEALTKEYQDLTTQLHAIQSSSTYHRIPGQNNPEQERDAQLFSSQANAERMFKLQQVRDAHKSVKEMFRKMGGQRATLNTVLNGIWQPTSLDRTQLERLLGTEETKGDNLQNNLANGTTQRSSLPFVNVVTEWNDSLLKMQAVLAQHLSPVSPSTSTYLSSLSSARQEMDASLREHSVKLSNLRSLAHSLRTSLIPGLETELSRLQKELLDAGTFHGPIHVPGGLIPPTPARCRNAASLAVPPTPAASLAGYAPVGLQRQGSNGAQTPLQVQQRLPSRVSESVRRAAQAKGQRGWVGQQQAQQQQQQRALHTIHDAEEHLVSPLHQQLHSSMGASVAPSSIEPHSAGPTTSAVTRRTPDYATNAGEGGLFSPLQQPDQSTSPAYGKKLVFSPGSDGAVNTSQRLSMDGRLSLDGNGRVSLDGRTSLDGNASSIRSTSQARDSFDSTILPASTTSRLVRPSLSPIASQQDQSFLSTTSSSVGKFTASPALNRSTPPATSSHSNQPRFLSPGPAIPEDAEGLLGKDELWYEEEPMEDQPDQTQQQQNAEDVASSRFGSVHVRDGNVSGDEDEEDDEIVFSTGTTATGVNDTARRSSASSTSVDPDAPTPAPARKVERRFDHATPVTATTSLTTSTQQRTPQQRAFDHAREIANRLGSPTYNYSGEAGLLDD